MNNFPAGTEDNVGTGTALVPTTVAARATVDLVLDERQQTTRTVDWLEPLADDAVKAYLRDKRADPVIAAQLKAAWDDPPGAGPKASAAQQQLAERGGRAAPRHRGDAREPQGAGEEHRRRRSARQADRAAGRRLEPASTCWARS